MVKIETHLELLGSLEGEFRNQYWIIRNARYTNWRAVNRTRLLAEFMYLIGVPRWAVKEARYCLRQKVCERCYKGEVRCYAFTERAKNGEFSRVVSES